MAHQFCHNGGGSERADSGIGAGKLCDALLSCTCRISSDPICPELSGLVLQRREMPIVLGEARYMRRSGTTGPLCPKQDMLTPRRARAAVPQKHEVFRTAPHWPAVMWLNAKGVI